MIKMERSSLLVTLFILTSTLYFRDTLGDCNSNNADDFVAINPTNYDRNYSSITTVGERPYGFQKATWYFNNPARDNPCVKVTGAASRRVEVMVEAVPQSRICVKQEGVKLACADSGTGRLYSCKSAPADSVVFEFYCDQACAEHDVQFWYRIVLGETPDQDPEDHWCDYRSLDQYPEDLLQLPLDYTFPVDTTTPFNRAPSSLDRALHSLLLIGTLLCFLSLIFTNN